MPAIDPLSDKAFEMQFNFLRSAHSPILLEILVKNNFMTNADITTKRFDIFLATKFTILLKFIMEFQ